jgi:ribonucleoside-diphosphate reductase alpha chain
MASPPTRERLSADRPAITRVFRLTRTRTDGSQEIVHLYFTAGLYENGRPGEVFVKGDRMGSLTSGALDAVGVLASLLLQYGVPLQMITSKLRHTRYEPNGFTRDPEFPSCSSALDLLAQWLEQKFGQPPIVGENTEGK